MALRDIVSRSAEEGQRQLGGGKRAIVSKGAPRKREKDGGGAR